jgi:thiamine-monophosphate kinase
MNEKNDIKKLGEFGLIDTLTSDFALKNKSSLLGVGDDATIIGTGNTKTLVTTDMLNEGVHFDLVYTPLKHLGYKAVISNLSDIYTMNGKPEQILVSMAISAKFTTEMIEEIYTGIKMACDVYRVDLVGGDITSSLTGLVISITAVGVVAQGNQVCRTGGSINDIICVSGNLGAAYMGLQLLEREKKVFESTPSVQPELTGHEYILERQLKPEARKDIVELLDKIQLRPTSMIDISDGLSSELHHLCRASNLGCRIFSDKIPVDKDTQEMAYEMGMDPLVAALNGGEDYELLFTIAVADYDKIKDGLAVTAIGHMVDADEGLNMVTPEGNLIQLKAMGWDGLKKEN